MSTSFFESRQVLNINKIPVETIIVASVNGTDRILSPEQILRYLGAKKDRKTTPKINTANKTNKV